jgi:hypothetical protein
MTDFIRPGRSLPDDPPEGSPLASLHKTVVPDLLYDGVSAEGLRYVVVAASPDARDYRLSIELDVTMNIFARASDGCPFALSSRILVRTQRPSISAEMSRVMRS